MRPLPFSLLRGWEPSGWGNWVISDAESFKRLASRADGSESAETPDFTKHRVVLIREGWVWKSRVTVEANSGLIRVRSEGEAAEKSRKSHLLLIPAGDAPVYGPEGRIREAEPEE